jgi:hypothetical protein
VRGKSRMSINYKRLNDTTVDDAYNIANKQEWINIIQGSKYFSKFDSIHMSSRTFTVGD